MPMMIINKRTIQTSAAVRSATARRIHQVTFGRFRTWTGNAFSPYTAPVTMVEITDDLGGRAVNHLALAPAGRTRPHDGAYIRLRLLHP